MTASTYIVQADGFPHIDKDSDAKLNYSWNWADWLVSAGSASIQSAVITADTGITVVGGATIQNGIVSQILSGGTVGVSYKVACKVTSNDGLIDERTVVIDVKER